MKLPGDKDPSRYIEEVIRVNHAGEYGAKRIYEGQLKVLKDTPARKLVAHMAEQEANHLQYFENELVRRKIRPTALFPFWHFSGYLLGAGTAFLGEQAAMICTKAIEEVIEEHYDEQITNIGSCEQALKERIIQFRKEETEHKHIAKEYEVHSHPGYAILENIIKAGCRFSIFLAKKI